MHRRTYLTTMAGVAALTACAEAPKREETAEAPTARETAASGHPIQLHVDLQVDPAREQEMVANFENEFRPTIAGQPGFVGVTLLKLRDVMVGPAPGDAKYRLIISFDTEDQRKTWIATDEHQRVWPMIEGTLTGSKYSVILYDHVGGQVRG